MRQAVTINLRCMPVAVMGAIRDFHRYPVKVQVKRVIEPEAAPLQLVAEKQTPKPRPPMEAKAKAVSEATAGLASVQSLAAEAKRSKSCSAVFAVGRVKIEARYSKSAQEVSYFVNQWPRHPEFVEMLLERVHSGFGTGGMHL